MEEVLEWGGQVRNILTMTIWGVFMLSVFRREGLIENSGIRLSSSPGQWLAQSSYEAPVCE